VPAKEYWNYAISKLDLTPDPDPIFRGQVMTVAFPDGESLVKRIHVGYHTVHAVVCGRMGIGLYA
jgi:hypothetical protein